MVSQKLRALHILKANIVEVDMPDIVKIESETTAGLCEVFHHRNTGLCVRGEGNLHILKAYVPDGRLRQTVDIAGRNLGVGTFEAGEAEGAHIRSSVIHRQMLTRPDIFALPVGITAVIPEVDDHRRQNMLHPDIVKGERVIINEDGIKNEGKTNYSFNDSIRKGIADGNNLCILFTYDHWTAIYRREMVLSSGALYGNSRHAQDTTFLLRVCYGIKSIEFEDRAIYYYVYRSDSSVRNLTPKRLEAHKLAFREKMDFLANHPLEERELRKYINILIGYELRMQAACMENENIIERANEHLNAINAMIKNVPLDGGTTVADKTVDAFLKYGVNITLNPLGMKLDGVGIHGCIKTAKRVTDFLREHPEEGKKYKDHLRIAFEQVLKCKTSLPISERKEVDRMMRQMICELPDKTLLTEEYVAMKLYVDYGIDVFKVRDSNLGKSIKKAIAMARKMKH